jgi:AcrR family transcriptional regulator
MQTVGRTAEVELLGNGHEVAKVSVLNQRSPSSSRGPSQRGQYRGVRADAAITNAVENILLRQGYTALTVERVAKPAGTTRAAVYRRYKNRGQMVLNLGIQRFGTDPAPRLGELTRDLEALQTLQVEFFSHPIVRASIAGLLTDVAEDAGLAADFFSRFMGPRRASVAELLRGAAACGEVTIQVDPATISDLLTGPLLLHAIIPALGPLTDELVAATITTSLAALGAPARKAPRPKVSRQRPAPKHPGP